MIRLFNFSLKDKKKKKKKFGSFLFNKNYFKRYGNYSRNSSSKQHVHCHNDCKILFAILSAINTFHRVSVTTTSKNKTFTVHTKISSLLLKQRRKCKFQTLFLSNRNNTKSFSSH